MIKIFLVLIFSLILNTFAMADIKDDFEANFSKFVSNLVPGEGTTEASIDLRENNSPDFSILGVRELEKSIIGNTFTQFSLFSTEQNNDDRIVGNLGFGKRKLSDDKLMLTGSN